MMELFGARSTYFRVFSICILKETIRSKEIYCYV